MIIQEIKESGCEFRVIKLKGTGKNALDFYIAAECGIISERGENEIAIISNELTRMAAHTVRTEEPTRTAVISNSSTRAREPGMRRTVRILPARRKRREERKYRIENYY